MKARTFTPRVLILTGTLFLAGSSVATAQDEPPPPGEVPAPQEAAPQETPPPPPPPYPQQPYPTQSPYPQMALAAPPGFHRHDGFYFRGILGFGGGASKASDIDVNISGTAMDFALAFGGAVAENFVIYGELGGVALLNPDIKSGGSTISTEDLSVTTSGIGAGFAYYIMPANLYLSASLMLSTLSIDSDGEELGETDTGLGTNFRVGKEWWTGDEWGLGVYGGVHFARMKDKDEGFAAEPPTWTTSAFTLGFTATYN